MVRGILLLLNIALIVFALRGKRWAYGSLLILAVLYFPLSVGFSFKPGPVDLSFDLPLVLISLKNYRHIILFCLFFIMTSRQLGSSGWKHFLTAAAITLALGVYVECAQAVTGNGHCRLRDLIPDMAAIILGSLLVYGFFYETAPTSPDGGSESQAA